MVTQSESIQGYDEPEEQPPDLGRRQVHVRQQTGNRRQRPADLDGLAALIEPVDTHFLWRPRLRDPADEMVLEAAVNGRAEVLVTFNLRDYGAIPLQFGIEALRPRDALRRIAP